MYNSFSYKSKQFFWLLIKLSIVIGCGCFMYTKLTENEQISFPDFYKKLTENEVLSIKNIVILITFTFLNWFLEILKWEKLVAFCKKISFKKAAIQNLASLIVSLITPNRIGEYGAKALYFSKPLRKQIVGLNLVGNFYQMLATVFFGIIGFTYFTMQHKVAIDFYKAGSFLLIISVLIFLVNQFNYQKCFFYKIRNFINKIQRKLHITVDVISLLRFLIFSHQFYFLLLIFKVDISYINAIYAITPIYFVASFVPMLSLFDVRCKLKKSQPHKLHIWFLPTLKPKHKKLKEQFLANALHSVSQKICTL